MAEHEWRRKLIRDLGDTIWEDPDLTGLPQEQQDRIEDLADKFAQDVCAVVGHEPIQDHCGMPEHDLCAWCRAGTPGQAPRVTASKLGGEH